MKVATVRKCTGNMIEGSLEVKLPRIWTDEKQRWEESERREEQKREDQRRSKSRLAKAAGAEPSGEMRDEKLHAVVAQSTFPSQNVQSIPFSDHFWKLRCRKSARRCGAKHISKSKCTKHTMLGPLLEVQMSKKCRKSARRCGAKHISKSKVLKKTEGFEPFLT